MLQTVLRSLHFNLFSRPHFEFILKAYSRIISTSLCWETMQFKATMGAKYEELNYSVMSSK